MTNRAVLTMSLLTFAFGCGDSGGAGTGAGGAGAGGGSATTGSATTGGGGADACEVYAQVATDKCAECPGACDGGTGGAGGGTGAGGAAECDQALAECLTPCIDDATCGALDGTDADAQTIYVDCVSACI